MAQQEQQPRLRFAGRTQISVRAVDPADMLREFAVPALISRRVFDMVAEYVDKHAAVGRGEDKESDMHGWDRRFIARVDDTDTLHDLFLASKELEKDGLMDLCAQRMADMFEGGRTVEEARNLLGVARLTPEQDHQAQHDRLLRIIR